MGYTLCRSWVSYRFWGAVNNILQNCSCCSYHKCLMVFKSFLCSSVRWVQWWQIFETWVFFLDENHKHNPYGLLIWSSIVPGLPIWILCCSMILFLNFCSSIVWLCVPSSVMDEDMHWALSSEHHCGLNLPRKHCLTAQPLILSVKELWAWTEGTS